MREICIVGSGSDPDYSHYKNSIVRRCSYSKYYNLLFNHPRASFRYISPLYLRGFLGTQLKICKVS